jgi:uncharacterized membrane protein YkgB
MEKIMIVNIDDTALSRALLALRLGVFIVMFMWTVDKFVNPDHAAGIFSNFYGLEGLGSAIVIVLGVIELVLILAFLAGLYKKWTYGAILLLHGASTLASWRFYLGFDNLLFFAAWPMLAACYALFILRDYDTLMTVASKPKVATA